MNAPTDLKDLQPVVDVNLIDGGNPANIGTLFAALALAQGLFQPIVKNRDVTVRPKDQTKASYKFRYADLEEIGKKTTPHLSANGFALLSLVTKNRDGGTKLRTILGHSCGARIESELDVPRGRDGEIKDFGAVITYLRRYVVGAMLGVAADDDLDEDGQERGAGEGHSAPNTAPVHAGLRDAKTIGELAKVMAGLPKDDKAKYAAYYNQRQDELEAKTGKGDDL
jgi:hypothetical protein